MKAYLPTKVVASLSTLPGNNEMFSTFDTPSSNIQKLNENSQNINTSSIDNGAIKIEANLKYKRRERNRVPRKFDSKRDQIRLSSANHYKPLENIRSPLPIQVSSDEEEDYKSVERLPYTEEAKFLIPNEGNVNKSPMFLFKKKDNKANAFINSSEDLREKSMTLYHNGHIREGKRSTTPQQKNSFIYSNLLDQEKSNFESAKPEEMARKSYKIDTKTIEDVITNSAQRDYPQKATKKFNTDKVLGGAVIGSQMPTGIGKIRQSLDRPL